MGRAERVARRLPPDIALALTDVGIGVALTVPSPTRESGAAFTAARALLPIRVWGALFVLLGLLLTVATRRGRRYKPCAKASRIVGPGLYSGWAIAFTFSALQDSATWLGVAVFAYFAYRHSYAPPPPGGSHRATRTTKA